MMISYVLVLTPYAALCGLYKKAYAVLQLKQHDYKIFYSYLL